MRIKVNNKAASWMRPFSCLAFLSIPAAQVSAEVIPRVHEDLVRKVLVRSILSQTGINLRANQTEWIQTSTGFQISHKRYLRSKGGNVLAIVTDSRGVRTGVMSDDGHWNRSYDPKASTLTESRSMRVSTDPHLVRARVVRILTSYRVHYLGVEMMAGRRCHKLLLDPHDLYGRPIKVWIDAGTGVTLAREESDRRGNFIGMTIFRSVEYPKDLPSSLLSLSVPKGTRIIRVSRSPLFRSPGALKKWAKVDMIQPVSMPRGFEFESGEMLSLAGSRTVCLRYSDGLAVITMFQTHTSQSVNETFQSVAWKLLPSGESVAISGQSRVTTVIIGPRESDGIVMVARALDRQREQNAIRDVLRSYVIDSSTVSRLRDRGFGMDCIVGLLEISRISKRKLTALVNLRQSGLTWRQILTKLKIDLDLVSTRVEPFECR